jgi:hypothetical protein
VLGFLVFETTTSDVCNSGIWTSVTQKADVESREMVAMAILADVPGDFPGKKQFLTSINLVILFFILEKRTSKSIEDLLKTGLIDPREENHTGIYGDGGGGIGSPGKPTQPWAHTFVTDTPESNGDGPFGIENQLACRVPLHILLFFPSLLDLVIFMNLHLQEALGHKTAFIECSLVEKAVHSEPCVPTRILNSGKPSISHGSRILARHPQRTSQTRRTDGDHSENYGGVMGRDEGGNWSLKRTPINSEGCIFG